MKVIPPAPTSHRKTSTLIAMRMCVADHVVVSFQENWRVPTWPGARLGIARTCVF